VKIAQAAPGAGVLVKVGKFVLPTHRRIRSSKKQLRRSCAAENVHRRRRRWRLTRGAILRKPSCCRIGLHVGGMTLSRERKEAGNCFDGDSGACPYAMYG
jgi:hypothetical protein